jgi:ribosome-associated toxin RatA of RatAB toxin-antitoxin module
MLAKKIQILFKIDLHLCTIIKNLKTMKKVTILMLGSVMILSQAYAQTKTNVSENVKSAFSQKFPAAKKVKWDKESETEWEAEFKINGEEYSANFTSNGTWKETEHEIEESAIPAAVKQTLDSEFAGYDIEEAEISETVQGKVYEFALEKDEIDLEVAISPDGKVVKKEIKKEENEND